MVYYHLPKFLKRLTIVSVVVALLVLYFPNSQQLASAFDLSTFSISKKTQFYIGPGVQHSAYNMKSSSNIEAVNMLEVDPKNPYIQVEVTSPDNRVLALDSVRNLAKKQDKDGHRVIAAFNGDFFKTTSPYTGQPIGLQITNGEIITSPKTSKSVLSINKNGQAVISDQVKMTTQLQISGVSGSKTLSGINRGRNKETQKDSLFLFTSKFNTSTKTSGDEVEILLNPKESKLTANKTLTATVEDIYPTKNSRIPEGKWVLAATGSQADWMIENIDLGSKIELKINFSSGLDQALQAVSGLDLVVKNGSPTENALKDTSGRQPRTMFSTKQGKLYITTFDGRQPGYSDGVTLAEGANYLAKNGMETAMNLDGGGSTTYAARLPGEQSLSILNKPSDGSERKVANSLLIVSTAPVSAIAKLTSNVGDTIKVLARAKVPITFKGQDKYYNGVPVNANKLNWTASSGIGKVDRNGMFTAGTKAAKGKITAKSNGVSKSINVEVVTELKSLSISPKDGIIIPGSKQTFKVKGYDNKGKEVTILPELLKWETRGNIGKLDSKGTLSSVKRIQAGKVIVSYGKTKAEASINVGKSPTVLEDFEDIKDLQVTTARSVSGKGILASSPKPIKAGKRSIGLLYDFTGTTGTSAAYVNFKDKKGNVGRTIESRPTKLELWVYGDGNNHWLRGSLQDGNGKLLTVDFTSQGKLNWKGWKKVYTTIPANSVIPLKLRQVYVVETNNTNKNKGTIYFDQLRAIYE